MKLSTAWQARPLQREAHAPGERLLAEPSAADAPEPHPPLAVAIRDRWSLLGDADLTAVTTLPALVAAIAARYRITDDEAATQVREWTVAGDF